MANLPTVPDSIFDADGYPQFGTYRGWSPDTDLTDAARSIDSAGQRFLREKKWQWFAVADARLACGGTLLDVGYATTVFLWIFDRSTGRMVADVSELLPPFGVDISDDPTDGDVANLRGLRRKFVMERDDGTLQIRADFDDIRLALDIDETAPDPMTAICPLLDPEGDHDIDPESAVNVTQKQSCLPVEGRVYADGRSFQLSDDAVGLLDFSHGLLMRETAWRWAIGGGTLDEGTPVGFNLSEGFTRGYENAVWIGDSLQKTADVNFDFNADSPDQPWTVRSSDGAIDLTLMVEGVRHHQTNLRIVTSEYLQPLGRWHGRVVDREVHGLFGIAESHSALW